MRRNFLLPTAALLFLLPVFAFAQASSAPKPESIGAPPATVAGPIAKALEPKGYRVATPDGPVDLWLRAELPAGKNSESGVIYDKLPPSSFVGVITFAKDSKDYKGQRIAAGTYTMRYEVQPDNGDHLGTAPTRDFVLLVPVASDPDPAAVFDVNKLVALSQIGSGTRHPLPLNLLSPESKSLPAIYSDQEGHTIFAANMKTPSGPMPIAIVVNGTAAQ
jgi:hypothetical protein